MRCFATYLSVLLLSGSIAAATTPIANVICDDTARLEHQLKTVLHARKQGEGLRGPDALMQVWINPSSGNWTLVQNYAGGTSCIVAMGEHWETVSPPNPT